MKKYIRITLGFVAVIILVIIGRHIWENNEYVLSFQANRNIEVDGLEFMMTQEDVREMFGMEDEYIHGWGGYYFKYIDKGIYVTFLDDGSTSFYNKVKEIEILKPNYEIYGIYVGMQHDEAIETLDKQDFTKGDSEWLWKGNIYISLERSSNQFVSKIMIGIKDRISSETVY